MIISILFSDGTGLVHGLEFQEWSPEVFEFMGDVPDGVRVQIRAGSFSEIF